MRKHDLKTAIFADVQNIYYTTRQTYRRPFNYREMWKRISIEGEIVTAFAYAIDRRDEQQMKFQAALRHMGFEVKLKPYIQRSDGSAKGDWDVGITIDVLDAIAEVERIVLLSGDGDFDLLMQRVQRAGVQAHAWGVPDLTANALVRSVDRFTPIDSALLL